MLNEIKSSHVVYELKTHIEYVLYDNKLTQCFCHNSRQKMAGVSVACRVARPLTNSGKLLAVAGLNKVSFESKTVGHNFVI